MAIENHSHDLFYQLQLVARQESAGFVVEHLSGPRSFQDKRSLLEYCLKEVSVLGLCCEFGVATGKASSRSQRSSFRRFFKGSIRFRCFPRNGVRVSITVISFRATGFRSLQRMSAFMSDGSTRRFPGFLWSRFLVSDSLLLFAEYFNYSG